MYQTFGPELARERMAQRMREAEAYRLGAETRRARAAGHRSTIRRVAGMAVHVLAWPVRH